MWNATGECIGSQAGHRGAVNSLSEINSNLHLKLSQLKYGTVGLPLMMSLGADHIIKIWDMKRFKCVSEVNIGAATGPLTKAIWVGQSIVTASGGNIRIWDHNHKTDNNSSESERPKVDSSGGPLSGPTPGVSEWRPRGLGSHAQTCTDLISTDSFIASASKSGQIFKWSRE